MAGTVVAAGGVAVTAALMLGLMAAGGAGVASQRAAGSADAAALAAADALSGAVPGDPCERAGEVAAATGFVVTRCAADGLVATVTVGGEFATMALTATARAGPAP